MRFEEIKSAIETLIDSSCADTVKGAFAEICHEKAQHVREAWQDSATAQPWEALARSLDKVQNQGV